MGREKGTWSKGPLTKGQTMVLAVIWYAPLGYCSTHIYSSLKLFHTFFSRFFFFLKDIRKERFAILQILCHLPLWSMKHLLLLFIPGITRSISNGQYEYDEGQNPQPSFKVYLKLIWGSLSRTLPELQTLYYKIPFCVTIYPLHLNTKHCRGNHIEGI